MSPAAGPGPDLLTWAAAKPLLDEAAAAEAAREKALRAVRLAPHGMTGDRRASAAKATHAALAAEVAALRALKGDGQ